MFIREKSSVTNDNGVLTVKLGRETCLAPRSIGKRSKRNFQTGKEIYFTRTLLWADSLRKITLFPGVYLHDLKISSIVLSLLDSATNCNSSISVCKEYSAFTKSSINRFILKAFIETCCLGFVLTLTNSITSILQRTHFQCVCLHHE